MGFVDSLVRSPVKVAVGVLLVALFGSIALMRMPMQLTPEVQTPTITVETRWPGASPQEIEREIITEQEEQLKSVEGITKLSSDSADSSARVVMEFNVGTNMDSAVVDVIGRLEQVREYPEDADKPTISTSNLDDRPIARYILTTLPPKKAEFDAFVQRHPELREKIATVRATASSGLLMLRLRSLLGEHPEVQELLKDLPIVTTLKRFAEDEIEARLERVPGVSQADVTGGLEDELEINVDPQKLAARGVTIQDLRNVLVAQNTDVSAGDFWEDKRRWVVRTLGQFRTPEQVENQLIKVMDGAPVYMRDVASVQLGYKKPDGLVRRFGESGITMSVSRENNANVIEVMKGLKAVMNDLNKNLLGPKGLLLLQNYDETEYIYSSVDLVQENIVIGGSLTMIVLMSFLHLGVRTLIVIPLIALTAVGATFVSPWLFVVTLAIIITSGFWFARGALVVGLAIPTSIVGTFLILGLLGRSLNVISLAGLAFAVGMLVDNAVVVLENIYRRYSLGEEPFEAAAKGASEVVGAIIASTLTTIAVFLPIVFIEEEAGQLFRDIALAISAAVGLSMLVSFTLIPTAAARLFRPHREQTKRDAKMTTRASWARRLVVEPIERVAEWMIDLVVALNRWLLSSKLISVALVAIMTGASLYVSYALFPKVEYLPTGNRNLIFGILQPPPGYNIDELMRLGETVEASLRPYWDVEPGTPEAAKLDGPIIADLFFFVRGKRVVLGLRADDPQRVAELVPLVNRVCATLPGTNFVTKQASLFESGLTSGRTIEIEITGPDLKKLVALGGQTLSKVKELIPSAQARPVPSLDLSSPEVHVVPKLVQAAQMGVTTSDLGYTVNALVDGAYAGDYYLSGNKIDITIKGEKEYAQRTQDLAALPIATPIGILVPLEAVASIDISSGPEQINHRERLRAISIEVSPPASIPLETAMEMITNEILIPLQQSGQLDGGYRMNLAGTADKLRQTWQSMQFNMLLALVITYLLMAALFESWLYPLVIIFSVPLGAVGGVIGLNLLNLFVLQPLDVLTMLGFVILIGTVVNNPILIVHQSLNHMRDDGMSPKESILESTRSRIRPIFMTTITTVLGLLPLVIFPGDGSELYRGLGAVVLGGLVVSTVFTLVLVPVLFSLTMDAKAAIVKLLFDRRGANDDDEDGSDGRPRSKPVRERLGEPAYLAKEELAGHLATAAGLLPTHPQSR